MENLKTSLKQTCLLDMETKVPPKILGLNDYINKEMTNKIAKWNKKNPTINQYQPLLEIKSQTQCSNVVLDVPEPPKKRRRQAANSKSSSNASKTQTQDNSTCTDVGAIRVGSDEIIVSIINKICAEIVFLMDIVSNLKMFVSVFSHAQSKSLEDPKQQQLISECSRIENGCLEIREQVSEYFETKSKKILKVLETKCNNQDYQQSLFQFESIFINSTLPTMLKDISNCYLIVHQLFSDFQRHSKRPILALQKYSQYSQN